MAAKEATARIKINKLLEAVGWRFFTTENGPANIKLEPNVTIKTIDLDALGENFEKTSKGFIDFLLLDSKVNEPRTVNTFLRTVLLIVTVLLLNLSPTVVGKAQERPLSIKGLDCLPPHPTYLPRPAPGA